MRVTDKAIVEEIHSEYPGMTKYIFSMTNYPHHYGIQLTPGARHIRDRVTGKPKKDVRRLPHRLSCRLGNELFERFELVKRAQNYTSNQDFLLNIIKTYVEVTERVHGEQ